MDEAASTLNRASTRWTLLLFVLTGAGTLSARHTSNSVLALAFDLIPMVGALFVGSAVAIRLIRHRIARFAVWSVSYACAACALIGSLGVAHLVSVLAELPGKQFVYDFRMYSLVQLGLILIGSGYLGVACASRMVDGSARSTRHMILVWIIVLGTNAPLMPLQGFAVLFTALGCVGLLNIWLTRLSGRRSGAEQ